MTRNKSGLGKICRNKKRGSNKGILLWEISALLHFIWIIWRMNFYINIQLLYERSIIYEQSMFSKNSIFMLSTFSTIIFYNLKNIDRWIIAKLYTQCARETQPQEKMKMLKSEGTCCLYSPPTPHFHSYRSKFFPYLNMHTWHPLISGKKCLRLEENVLD